MLPAARINSLRIPANRLGVYTAGTSFFKGGGEIRGIGINHFDMLLSLQQNFGTDTNYLVDMPAIKARNIPFIRFAVGWYDRNSWLNYWWNNQATFIANLDAIVIRAEQLGIGLVPAFLWDARSFCDTSYEVYGEFSPPKDLAYKGTPARKLFEYFVTQIVSRYKDSPAIWAWELGNEMLSQIGPEFFSMWALDGSFQPWLDWGEMPQSGDYRRTDKMSMQEWQALSRDFVYLVRSLDPHKRFISSGAAIGNQFAVGAQTANTLSGDTQVSWNGVASTEGLPWVAFREKEYDCISMHMYPRRTDDGLFFSDGDKTQPELVAITKSWCDANNKALFLSEWGATYRGDSTDQISTTPANEATNFANSLAAVVNNNVKLSAVWNYGGNYSGSANWMKWFLKDPSKSYQLDAIQARNIVLGH